MTGRKAPPAAVDAALRLASGMLEVETDGAGMIEITQPVGEWLLESGARDGLLTLFIRHTSASLTIQENADPDVVADLVDAVDRLAPDDAPYRHRAEGPDDMPAHIKAALTATSLTVPVSDGRMALGTWQGIYVWEHRTRRRRRSVALSYLGTCR